MAQNSFEHFPRRRLWWVIITTLNFRKFKVALNPLGRIFLNFAKSCILSCLLQFDNKKWRSPSSFLSYKGLKLKLRVFLAGHIVAMVTYCATKIYSNLFPNDWTVCWYHDVGVNKYRVVIMTHQTLKSWKELETVSSHLNSLRLYCTCKYKLEQIK